MPRYQVGEAVPPQSGLQHRLQVGGLHVSVFAPRSRPASWPSQEMVFHLMQEPFKIKTTNSMAMGKLGLVDKKLLRAPLYRNFLFHIHAHINDIQKTVMSDTMIVRSLKRSLIHLAQLSIKDVRNITKMTNVSTDFWWCWTKKRKHN